MSDLFITIVGYTASICLVLGYLPQAIVTIRTRETDSIALPTFCMLGLGSLLFVFQGIGLQNWPIVITNSISAFCSMIIFGIKMYNDFVKKK